jgi:hypothetical protein
LQASSQLKAEGNTLHSAGKYSQAAEKYKRGKDNLEVGGPGRSAAVP